LEAIREDVEQEPADELLCAQRHGLDPITVSVILPAKPDLPFIDGEQTIIGDGDPVCVAPKVFQDLLWPGERPLGVDNPFGVSKWRQVAEESGAFIEWPQGREEP
jgi:hypothetical protein